MAIDASFNTPVTVQGASSCIFPQFNHFIICTVVPIDHELLKAPRGNLVHYNFLKVRYIRSKMTYVGHLAVGAYLVTAM